MAANEVIPGPTAGYVIENVKRLRQELRFSQTALSDRLSEVGRPILPSGINRLENGRRRIDVDDLLGLSAAFGVSPVALLLPPTTEGEIEVTEKIRAPAREVWDWVRARRPLPALTNREDDEVFARVEFTRRSLPAELRRYPATGAGLDAMREDNPNVRVVRPGDVAREVTDDAEAGE